MPHSQRNRISIIIPVLNEADRIGGLLSTLQSVRADGHEIIVVDGGSNDGSIARALPLADKVVIAARGRARQMMAGTAQATGDRLWFVHADTIIHPARLGDMLSTITACPLWGFFPVRLDSRKPMLGLVARLMNLRSRLTGIATGDQGIFITRSCYRQCGGYRDLALMEDIDLCRRLRRYGPPFVGHVHILTSARKWEHEGVLHTVILMWLTRLRFFLGADTRKLASSYYARHDQ